MSEWNTPWKVVKSNKHAPYSIYDKDFNLLWPEIIDNKAAEFIVEACNNYESLKQENEKLKEVLRDIVKRNVAMKNYLKNLDIRDKKEPD